MNSGSKRRFWFLLWLLVTAALVVWNVHEIATLARQRQRLYALEATLEARRTQARALVAGQKGTREQLEAAERQLQQLPASERSAAGARDAEIAAWLRRAQALRELFAADPGQAIPEMAWLQADDWLRVAKALNLDTEDGRREAMALLRAEAKRRFATEAGKALVRAQAADATPPKSAAELARFFDPPVDAAVLERYEVRSNVPGFRTIGGSPSYVLRERTAIDDEFDNRISVIPGGAVVSGASAWFEAYKPALAQAEKRYAADHGGGEAQSVEALAPYLQSPLDATTAAKLLRIRQRPPLPPFLSGR